MITPYPFQRTGAAFLNSGPYRYLMDDMGLGKTGQALLAARLAGHRKLAVVCPASAIGNWQVEHKLWYPEADLRVASWAAVSLGRASQLEGRHVILDEAHYAKNRKSKRAYAALKLAQGAGSASLLSGTPGRHAGELWTAFRLLWPELVPADIREYDAWLDHFCEHYPTRYGPKVTGHRAEHVPHLQALLTTVGLRRKLTDVGIEMPPLRVHLHRLPYDVAMDAALVGHGELLAQLEHELEEDTPQLARVRRIVGELKAPKVAELLVEELVAGYYPKIVVGYHHTSVGDVLASALGPFGVVRLDGSVPSGPRRQQLVDWFTRDPRIRVFLGQMQATAEALNLQAASEIAIVEPAWNADTNRQFIKRIHRIGQDSPCRARLFAVTGTLDEGVMAVITRNTQQQRDMGL